MLAGWLARAVSPPSFPVLSSHCMSLCCLCVLSSEIVQNDEGQDVKGVRLPIDVRLCDFDDGTNEKDTQARGRRTNNTCEMGAKQHKQMHRQQHSAQRYEQWTWM